VEGTVANVHWQTSVPVQEFARWIIPTSAESAFGCIQRLMPHGKQEVCTERVEDTGTGFGEVVEECRTETEQYCSYTRDEWTTIQTYRPEGNDLFPAVFKPKHCQRPAARRLPKT
jgi:hypothetical protein